MQIENRRETLHQEDKTPEKKAGKEWSTKSMVSWNPNKEEVSQRKEWSPMSEVADTLNAMRTENLSLNLTA